MDYVYNIGTFEVTARQYTEFRNAVAGADTSLALAVLIGAVACNGKHNRDNHAAVPCTKQNRDSHGAASPRRKAEG